MKTYLYILLSSIISGALIAIGATSYLVLLDQGKYAFKIIGSFTFGLGLFTIIHLKTWLYTGKVGYILENKPIYLLKLLVCFLGNAFGAFITAYMISLGNNNALKDISTSLIEAKLEMKWYQVLTMSIMCGIMIYIAVKGHQEATSIFTKTIFCFLAVSIFILCGFEHSVANIVYFTFHHSFNLKSLLYVIIMIIGNGIGSILCDGSLKLLIYLKEDKSHNENKERI